MMSFRMNVQRANEHPITLICLFHSQLRAKLAVEEILAGRYPPCSVLDGTAFGRDRLLLEFAQIGMPAQHKYRFAKVITHGGSLVWLRCGRATSEEVERIFKHYQAEKID